MTTSVLVLVGSLRAGSTNRQLAEAIVDLSAEEVDVTIYEGLVDLPFYNEDIDSDTSVPVSVTSFRAAVEQADAVLIVTPEYNGTLPAVIKNAIDWGSRPFGASALAGKPVAVIGSAFGKFGGVWAQDETRKSLGIAGARVLDDISVAIPGSLVRFENLHPRDDQEVAVQLAGVLQGLIAATTQAEAA
jgi:NAD(P)H-dependent FMN reductase